jgi:N-acetylglucosaminyl-diphospho-decaprenol L-rhamnosyltransferase
MRNPRQMAKRTSSSYSIDVVIVAYNRWDLTRSCLTHLGAQSAPHHVIVVDNGSTDDTRRLLRSEFPDVQLIEIDRNSAFAIACNRGVNAGRGEIVVLLNNDVDCRPDFLARLVAPLEAGPDLGSVVPLLLQPGETAIDSLGLACDRTLAPFPRHHGLPARQAVDSEPVLACPVGAAAAYRRAAWEQVGGLDEQIFAYGEDFDLGLRTRAAGWGTAAAPDAIGIHVGSATHGLRSAWQRRNGGFGRGYLLRRYGVIRSRAAARALLTEAIVVVGDALISRDLEAFKGRLEGWRAARSGPRLPVPSEALDRGITFAESLRLRRMVYRRAGESAAATA